jgi:hypothetical protein
MTDALAKLMIAKGVITDDEFKAQLGAKGANYVAALKRLQTIWRIVFTPASPVVLARAHRRATPDGTRYRRISTSF